MAYNPCRRCGVDYTEDIYELERENNLLRKAIELKEYEQNEYQEQLNLLKDQLKNNSKSSKLMNKYSLNNEKLTQFKDHLNELYIKKKFYLVNIEKINNFFSFLLNNSLNNNENNYYNNLLDKINTFQEDYYSKKNNNKLLIVKNNEKNTNFYHSGAYIRNSLGECEWTCCLNKSEKSNGCVQIPYSTTIDKNTKTRPKSASALYSSSSTASFFNPKKLIPKDEKESLFNDFVNNKYMVRPTKQMIFEKNKQTKTPSHYGFGSSLPFLSSDFNTNENVVTNVVNNEEKNYIFQVTSHYNNHASVPLASSFKFSSRNRPLSASIKRPGNPRTNAVLTRQLSDSHIPFLHPSPDLLYNSLKYKVGEAYNKTELIEQNMEKQAKKDKLKELETENILEHFIELEIEHKPFGIGLHNQPPSSTLTCLGEKDSLEKTITTLEKSYLVNSNQFPSKFVYNKKNPLQNSKTFLKFK